MLSGGRPTPLAPAVSCLSSRGYRDCQCACDTAEVTGEGSWRHGTCYPPSGGVVVAALTEGTLSSETSAAPGQLQVRCKPVN